MHKGRIVFCLFLIAVALYAILSALRWNFKAALFPLSVGIPLLILAGVQLLQTISGHGEPDKDAAVDLDFSYDVPPELARRRVVIIFSWIVAFIVSVYLLGFPLTVPLFIFAYLKIQGALGWPASAAATALTWGAFYGLFQWFVHLQFEAGAIQTWLGL